MSYEPKFNLIITNLDFAKFLVGYKWHDIAVTLLGPPKTKNGEWDAQLYSTGDTHLRVVIDDITMPFSGWETPNENHVKQVLEHTKNIKPGDNVLIHCRAGVSRSTATAIFVLVQHGATPEEAIEYVQSIRPILDPNELILKHADSVMGMKGKLINAYRSWANRQKKVLWNRMPIGRSFAHIYEQSFWDDSKYPGGSLASVTSEYPQSLGSFDNDGQW